MPCKEYSVSCALTLTFAMITCIATLILGVSLLYHCYHNYKSTGTSNENPFYSSKMEIIATFIIFTMIYQQIDQFFHALFSSLLAIIIHYLYFIYIIFLMKYRCRLMQIKNAMNVSIIIYLSIIIGITIDLILSILNGNFTVLLMPILCIILLFSSYQYGYKQSTKINSTHKLRKRWNALKMISFTTTLFMMSLLILFISQFTIIINHFINEVSKKKDDDILNDPLISINLLIIAFSIHISFGFGIGSRFLNCIFACCGCKYLQVAIQNKYKKNCTIPLLGASWGDNMAMIKDIEDKEKQQKQMEQVKIAKYWFTQNVRSRDKVVFGYIRHSEKVFDLLLPKCIAVLVVNYCEIATLEHLVEARKYALTIGKHVDIEQSIFERICRRKEKCLSEEQKNTISDILDEYDVMNISTDEILSQFARIAMQHHDEVVLKIIIDRWIELQRNDILDTYKESEFLMDILIYGTKSKLYQTCELLLSDKILKYMVFRPRPQCLLDALQTRDDRMIMVILNGLKKVNDYYFVCDDVFKECIKMDHIQCAQFVVEQSWHIPTETDYQLAERYYGAIHLWLLQRSSGSLFSNDNAKYTIFYNEEYD